MPYTKVAIELTQWEKGAIAELLANLDRGTIEKILPCHDSYDVWKATQELSRQLDR